MSAYQCWHAQREKLRESLRECSDASSAAYLTRHALAQVEQDAMAEQTDDLLRQQTGILFSCCKTSVNLLDISITTKVWVAQSQAEKPKSRSVTLLLSLAFVLLSLSDLYAYTKGYWYLWIPLAAAIAALAAGLIVLARVKKELPPSEDRLRVTARPDTEKLFSAIDAQMKAIDRYIHDFAYLNEQNLLRNRAPELKSISALADLMQSVYECEGEAREEAVAAAERLLEIAGVRAVQYQPEVERSFSVLPSKTETRTLVPALVSEKDGALLYRGTAAVQQRATEV